MPSYDLRQKAKDQITIALNLVACFLWTGLLYCSHFSYESFNNHSCCPISAQDMDKPIRIRNERWDDIVKHTLKSPKYYVHVYSETWSWGIVKYVCGFEHIRYILSHVYGISNLKRIKFRNSIIEMNIFQTSFLYFYTDKIFYYLA